MSVGKVIRDGLPGFGGSLSLAGEVIGGRASITSNHNGRDANTPASNKFLVLIENNIHQKTKYIHYYL